MNIQVLLRLKSWITLSSLKKDGWANRRELGIVAHHQATVAKLRPEQNTEQQVCKVEGGREIFTRGSRWRSLKGETIQIFKRQMGMPLLVLHVILSQSQNCQIELRRWSKVTVDSCLMLRREGLVWVTPKKFQQLNPCWSLFIAPR